MFRPRLEQLENRDCPTVFNIGPGEVAANVTALITAITTANSNGQSDIINLTPGSLYTFSTANNGTDGGNALPVITFDGGIANDITINANGAVLYRAPGSPQFRIIEISGGRLILNGASIVGGSTNFLYGGGIRVMDQTHTMGAVDNLVLNNSTIVNNSVTNGGYGGGIAVVYDGKATINSSTISGNAAAANGGGVSVFDAGGFPAPRLVINSSTIANNDAGSSGGGIRAEAGTTTLTNTIVADNTVGGSGGTPSDLSIAAPAVVNTVNSLVEALFGTITSQNAGTIIGQDPLLNVLKTNGGLSATHSLKAGSVAINAGANASTVSSFDQRGAGFNRIISGVVDMGAEEFQPKTVSVSIVSNAHPATVGQTIIFTATVTGTAAGSNAPLGGVLFYLDGVFVAASGLVNGQAQVGFSSLPAGNHTLVAVYSPMTMGDYGFNSNSAGFIQTVNALPTPSTPTTPSTPSKPVVSQPKVVYTTAGRRWFR